MGAFWYNLGKGKVKIMEYDIDSVLRYITYTAKLPSKWGYTKISNKFMEYVTEYGKKYNEEELKNDWTGMPDNESVYFYNLFNETFSKKELYFILKVMLEANHLTDVFQGMIFANAEDYESESLESLPDLKKQLIDTRKVLAGKYDKVDEYLTRAFTKLIARQETRNALDDLRFSLEQLLQTLYSNGKTLENNVESLRKDVKNKNLEPQVSSMIGQLLTLYPNYQNQHVKHHDTFNSISAEFIFDITATLIKFIVKVF